VISPTSGDGAGGVEWVLEAFDCDPARLRDLAALGALVDDLVATLALRPVAPAQWHQFPDPGGVTGLVLLAESHLALHTFPEHASLCLNLFCCVPRAEWDWAGGLARHVGAGDVRVRRLARRYAAPQAAPIAADVA
jgi:S-adenosylmethionine decarboxylase